MEETQVLYGDYNGHLRPLNLMYFSLDSRCLVADHPGSVAEEVESHFCPKCNGLFTTPDAISTENRCACVSFGFLAVTLLLLFLPSYAMKIASLQFEICSPRM